MTHRHRSLASNLDREVYQVVRRVLDERDTASSRVTTLQIYDAIKNSNSSLNRRPKRLLEDSIERVLDTIRTDDIENDSEEVLDAPASNPRDEPVKGNGLNKSIVGAWSTNTGVPSRSNTATPNASKREQREQRERQTNGEPAPKRRRTERQGIDHSPPENVSLEDMGGVEDIAVRMFELLTLPLKRPQYLSNTKQKTTRGILLHGPPGCGKTMFANALAATLKVNFISIAAPSVVSGMSGESEKALREHFEEAKRCAPCLMFIDEIDAITPKRESAQREMEKRIVAQLLTCLDDLDPLKNDGNPVVVLAATNRPDSLDPALRRGGRFDKEIIMPVPSEAVREKILRALTRNSELSDDIDFALLARRTPGCVGADLDDLVSTAANVAQKRYLYALKDAVQTQESEGMPHATDGTTMDIDGEPATGPNGWLTPWKDTFHYLTTHTELDDFASSTTSVVTMSDFLTALPQIQPSALREGFATIPSTSFSEIGALSTHITTLRNTLINPILQPELYKSFNLRSTAGILLWGPPGNGKTLLAKAVANASHANFISVKGPELLNKYVGESERSVRQLFTRARSSVPVIIFFDELDALVPRRDGGNSEASSRVVNTLLTELDGVGASREGIYVVAATNRPDIIDPAMLRPGRLETLLYVGLPGTEDRVDILKTLTKKLKGFEWIEDMAKLARNCESFSGADLESLVRQATFAAIQRLSPNGEIVPVGKGEVLFEDFVTARSAVQPSVSDEEHAKFEILRQELGR